MYRLYVIAIIGAIVAARYILPFVGLWAWNEGARILRRRVARLTILPPAILLFVGCNAGGLLLVDGGTAEGGSATTSAGTPCAEQDPACPPLPHVLVCSFYDGGPCQLGECVGTWRDCNHDLTDGCETDTSADPNHCGTCGAACASGVCGSGVCK